MYSRTCNRCQLTIEQETIEELYYFFPKDKRRPLGIAGCCKKCKAEERGAKRDIENIRWNNYYHKDSDNYKRHIIRVATRKHKGSARLHPCNSCGLPADEWHHLKYTIDDVIALCSICHEQTKR